MTQEQHPITPPKELVRKARTMPLCKWTSNGHQIDNDAAEVLRQWKNGKDEWHGWKCALTTLANQLDPEWTAEDCTDHILSIANQLGYGDYDDD